MLLIDRQIEHRCINQQMVVPYDPELLNPCSIDIRIGDTAKLLMYKEKGFNAWVKRKLWQYRQWGKQPEIELLDIDLSATTKDNPYWLGVGDRILVASLETFNMPDDVAGQFRLKSSRGREFYEHLEAGLIDPGWHGSKLTMEIINHNIEPLPLYRGFRMGQVVFFQLAELPRQSYRETGRYNNDLQVQESRG